MDGKSLPILRTDVPGPESKRWVERLANTECPAITARRARRKEHGGVEQDPIVWESAFGANVVDVDGNVFVDFTSAFAVVGIGHSHPNLQKAASIQSKTLIHAMGDVFPSRVKIELSEKLAELSPGDLRLSILGLSGSSSVEAALKTATVARKRSTIVAFSGAYHGLSYGALGITGFRREFKIPFEAQIGRFGVHFPYPYCYRCALGSSYPSCKLACLNLLVNSLDDPSSGPIDVAAVMVEPILGRGGIVVPPDTWMIGLAKLCEERGILLIADEIFTGFGRTGRWFACEWNDIVPDLLCIGKAMGGGFPISAVMGRPSVMQAWGLSAGDAVHTSTFLGNPLGCAMALSAIEAIEKDSLIDASSRLGDIMKETMADYVDRFSLVGEVRVRGSMAGVELVENKKTRTPATRETLRIIRLLLEKGYIVGLTGVYGNVVGLTPPFVTTDEQVSEFFKVFEEVLDSCSD